MKKISKILYIVSSILLSIMLLGAAFNYFTDTDMVELTFLILGYSSYLIYPLAICKILAAIVILPFKQLSNPIIKSWAYVGLFFNIVLALAAHLIEESGIQYVPALVALFLWAISYGFYLSIVLKKKEA